MQDDLKSRAKQRLRDLLKTALGGVVVAAASLSIPQAEVPAAPTTSIEKRVEQVRDQAAIDGAPTNTSAENLAAFHNWGNHWHNWNNWHNWHNWHNW